MHFLRTHHTNEANKAIVVFTDERDPACGNMSHVYDVQIYSHPVRMEAHEDAPTLVQSHKLTFQHGPIKKVGVNGLTNEVFLAILIDRTEGAQEGTHKNDFNARALEHLRAALAEFEARTKERTARAVEGTHAL